MIPRTNDAYRLLHNGTLALSRITEAGIRIHEDKLDETISTVDEQIDKLQSEIRKDRVYTLMQRRFKHKFSWDAPAQLGKVLFEEMGFKAKYFTEKTGQAQATEQALAEVDHPVIKSYLQMRKLMKTKSTFLLGIKREIVNGFIHPFFSLAGGDDSDGKGGARSYRSSASDPNSQNWPERNKAIKALLSALFIPRGKNRRLVKRDYSALEVRGNACYSKDPRLIEYILDPSKDMHRDMAMECYMLKRNQVSDHTRYCAKNKYVFPSFYGQYYKQMAPTLWDAIEKLDLKIEGTDISLKDHLRKQGIRKLGKCDHNEDPEPNTFEYHIQEVEKRFWGKRFPVHYKWRQDWYEEYLRKAGFPIYTGFWVGGYYARNDVTNYPVQGACFHCLLWSIIEIWKELKKRKMKTVLINEIHDATWADVPDDELEEYLDLSGEIMTKMVREHWKWIIVPLEVDTEITELGGDWSTKQKWHKQKGIWSPKAKAA